MSDAVIARKVVRTSFLLRGGITMIKIEQSVIIHRPVEEVWQFMSNVENVTKWDRGVLQARQTSEGPLGVGSTLQTVRQFFA